LTKVPPILLNDTDKFNYTSNTMKNSSSLSGEFRYKLLSISQKTWHLLKVLANNAIEPKVVEKEFK